MAPSVPSRSSLWRSKEMLYWFGVYALVVIAVLLPFLLLYLLVVVSWLGLSGIRVMFRSLRSVLAIRTGLSREIWSVIHR